MTGLIVFVSLVAAGGLVIGFTAGDWWAERRMRLDWEAAREARRAVREVRQWREPPEVAHEAYLAHEELASEWHDHPPLKWDDEGVPGCPSCERRWEVHSAQAVALASESDEEWMARNFADLHRFIDGLLAEAPDPAGELRDRQ